MDKIKERRRQENLIVNHFDNNKREKLLDTLPRLFSLTIIHNDIVENFNNLCRQIFCLPMLKYCKLSLEGSLTFEPLLISTNKGSSIEHLVITNTFHLDQLNALLSYVPHLRRFSLHDLHRSRNQETQTCSIKLNNLTHMDLKTTITFDELELTMIKNFFHEVQVLYISTNSDIAYLDANRWKRLILSYIPQLRIFDFQHRNMIENSNNNNYDNMINRFYSSFWYEHKWFFVHHFYKEQNVNEIIFYSINPYRRKEYTLYEQLNTNIPSYLHKNDVNSVDHVNIHGEKATKNCLSYFSKAMKLTLSHSFAESRIWLGLILNHIVPLKQLTTLIIDCGDFRFEQLINVLRFTPNIHTLTLNCQSITQTDSKLIQQGEPFRLTSNANRIINVTIKENYSSESIKLLVVLCPRIQHLTIDTYSLDLESIMRFILSETKTSIRDLCSICTKNTAILMDEILKRLIDSEELFPNYLIDLVATDLYIWW
ncbi:unnamed protein product [Rotaria sp. Silwood1]|nr:unnamed protein product [Rotaria sp. Silwood1]CAF1604817.1 unnamed protein product [Rotaria sp. Silwood1]